MVFTVKIVNHILKIFYLNLKLFVSTELMEQNSYISSGQASFSESIHRDYMSISAHVKSAQPRLKNNISVFSTVSWQR